jgi:hypothetical protein
VEIVEQHFGTNRKFQARRADCGNAGSGCINHYCASAGSSATMK